ncbi:MAG: hypothetical protein IJ772_01405 [Bacilli bacterium]|nr:hypothetical protein [Bacilli bacterium]
MPNAFITNRSEVETIINLVKFFSILKEKGEEHLWLKDFLRFYNSLNEQEQQILPKTENVPMLIQQMYRNKLLKVLEEIQDGEYIILDNPQKEKYDKLYLDPKKKEEFELLNKLSEKYIAHTKSLEPIENNIISIEEYRKRYKDEEIKERKTIQTIQELFESFLEYLSQQGFKYVEKSKFKTLFYPQDRMVCSLKLSLFAGRTFSPGEDTAKLYQNYFENTNYHSSILKPIDADFEKYALPDYSNAEKKQSLEEQLTESDIQILEELVYCYHTGVDILDYSSTKEQLRK